MNKFLISIVLFGLISCESSNSGTHLKTSHVDKNGSVYYEKLPLKSTDLHINDSSKHLSLTSFDFFDIFIVIDEKDNVTNFSITLNDEKRKHKYIEGRNPIPLTNWTVYNDLDGDSILDTMHQGGPDKSHTYILYENQWIRIKSSRVLWKYRETVKSYDRKNEYKFKSGKWIKL